MRHMRVDGKTCPLRLDEPKTAQRVPSSPAKKGDDGFKWLEAFNETLGEEQGRHLSKAEKDQVVVAKGISANPEEH